MKKLKIVLITKDEYLKAFDTLAREKQEYISRPKNSLDQFIAIQYREGTIVTACRLSHQKNNNLWIHGLFSLKKGYGKKLVEYIIKTRNDKYHIRLNCIGESLKEYYEKNFGFTTYLKQTSTTKENEFFYEMIIPTKQLSKTSTKKGEI